MEQRTRAPRDADKLLMEGESNSDQLDDEFFEASAKLRSASPEQRRMEVEKLLTVDKQAQAQAESYQNK